MSFDFKSLLRKIADGDILSREETRTAVEHMMSGEASDAEMGAFLMGLRLRGEDMAEITGAAEAMRAKLNPLTAPPGAVDTCGTGGDAQGTYNVSTASAIILAACGVPVAKHGNRAVSSKSGSADVLEELGVNIEASTDVVEKSLCEIGIGFLMAPRHHSAMRHVAPIRAALGIRTIFNLLGPLSNPAGAKRQVIGVFDEKWTLPLAGALGSLGSEKVWVVHGMDGLDELSISGPSTVACYENDKLTSFQVTPQQAGLPCHSLDDIRGGDVAYNATALKAILAGEKNAYRDISLLNTAAALIVAGKASDLEQGVEIAAQAIDNGKAEQILSEWIRISNE